MADFASLIPVWLDALLIAPFRWPPQPILGMWLGSAILAAYCVLLGEVTAAVLFWLGKRHYTGMQDAMIKSHNLSVDALHAGDKAAYLAINKQAHDQFGKTFFAEAALGMASLWPLPFALGWMALRFEGIPLYHIPGANLAVGYVFVLLMLYIATRISFSRLKPRLPFFGRVESLKKAAREARGPMRSFFTSGHK